MAASDRSGFSVGAAVTLAQLEQQPYDVLAQLRRREPVSWIPALNGWLVTRRDLAIEAMRDAEAFTVDDPRFTTAMVLGPSMLSLDGPEHERHRSPFAPSFRPNVVRDQFEDFLSLEANRLVAGIHGNGHAEMRSALAGPLAVTTVTRFLGLENVASDEILGWYNSIATAIVDLTAGGSVSDADGNAIRRVRQRVAETLRSTDSRSLLHEIEAQGMLRPEEIGSAAMVLMFGAIETAEGMTANALWHLLKDPALLEQVTRDRALVPTAIEESLRLEPAAAVIDRYTTRDVDLGDVTIPAGDLVTISLLAANRDPEVFDEPDRFDMERPNTRQHVSFVQGPHGCLGLHLTRLETVAAVKAVLDQLTEIRLDTAATTPPTGLVFRKPASLVARWQT